MLGIIGGMGVEAGIDFQNSLAIPSVRSDMQHPCRVAYLNGVGESPSYSIASAAEMLIERGATSLVMACNTAHAIYDEVLDIIRRPVINLVNSTIRSIKGLGAMWLGTTVLAHSTSLVRQHDIQLPSDKDQELVQAAIWAAKRGEFPYDGQIRRISSDKLVVAGCTEMPLVLRHAGISRFVNPVNLLL